MSLTIELLLDFVMVLTRISAFFLIVPVFGWKSIPLRIKVAMTILLSLFFSTIIPSSVNTSQISFLEAVLLLCNEAIYGFALGLIIALLFTAVKVGTRIVERQIGFAMAEILDPLTGETTQPLGSLMEMVFILIFLSVNGHHFFLTLISKSYESFPGGAIPTIPVLLSGITEAGSTMLFAGLKLAAPVLAAFLILMIILGVLARIVPEMNILFISLPLRVAMGLLMMMIFLPFFASYINELAEFMNKLLPV
ncbi:flagellar biosynthetic protein FliR [Planctomycetota bacterium]